MSMKRHIWKTFYITSGDAFGRLQGVWQSTTETRKNGKSYIMQFEDGIGMIETDVPVSILKSLFRIAHVRWQDYVSDTKSSWDS
jgi:hypothetical protein